MTGRYPRFRQYDAHGQLVLREGLLLCFFMRRPHDELAQAITRALDLYLDAVGLAKLGWYLAPQKHHDPEEDNGAEALMRPLDSRSWERVRDELREPTSCVLQLQEHENQVGGFHFEYYGRQRSTIERPNWPGAVSALSFWLPTEYLEEMGPSRVRGVAIAMARELPINSGYASLAFNYLVRFEEVVQAVHAQCFRYPRAWMCMT